MSEYLRENWEWIVPIATLVLGALTLWITHRGNSNKPEAAPGSTNLDFNKLALDLLAHQPAAPGDQSPTEEHLQIQDDQIRQLTEAIKALTKEKQEEDAPPGIDEALKQLQDGDTKAAEAIFELVKNQKKQEGHAAHKEAAAAAKHIGALAFLHDTQKALDAYREATELDPEDSDAWNLYGGLLNRIGNLDGAENALRRVLALGNTHSDKEAIAIATGNLGILAQARGDLDKAEDYLWKALGLNEKLDRREGIANQYGNLGVIAQKRKMPDKAESYFRKSFDIYEELGNRDGMANQNGNLGNIAFIGDRLDKAKEYYQKSLDLKKELGDKEGMAKAHGNLGNLALSRGNKLGGADDFYNEAEGYLQKSLSLNEELGCKEGMAIQCYNLGSLTINRGNKDEACQMWIKALVLFEQLGAQPQIEKTRALMAKHGCPSPDGSDD